MRVNIYFIQHTIQSCSRQPRVLPRRECGERDQDRGDCGDEERGGRGEQLLLPAAGGRVQVTSSLRTSPDIYYLSISVHIYRADVVYVESDPGELDEEVAQLTQLMDLQTHDPQSQLPVKVEQ